MKIERMFSMFSLLTTPACNLQRHDIEAQPRHSVKDVSFGYLDRYSESTGTKVCSGSKCSPSAERHHHHILFLKAMTKKEKKCISLRKKMHIKHFMTKKNVVDHCKTLRCFFKQLFLASYQLNLSIYLSIHTYIHTVHI